MGDNSGIRWEKYTSHHPQCWFIIGYDPYKYDWLCRITIGHQRESLETRHTRLGFEWKEEFRIVSECPKLYSHHIPTVFPWYIPIIRPPLPQPRSLASAARIFSRQSAPWSPPSSGPPGTEAPPPGNGTGAPAPLVMLVGLWSYNWEMLRINMNE